MEINNFLTTDFLATFTGTLFVVELIVFVSKNLPGIKSIPTRIYTFILSFSHLLIMGIVKGTINSSLLYFYSLIINSLVITVMLCGGYDVIIDKINLVTKKSDDSSQQNQGQSKDEAVDKDDDYWNDK